MVSIPYWTRSGVTAMKFRRINGPGPKYVGLTGQEVPMYNVEAIISHKPYIVICEGELDTVVAHHVCGVNAVGIAGVHLWKSHHQRMLKGFNDIFIVVDNDDVEESDKNPGQDLALRIIRSLPWARNITLPRGMDLSEFVQAEGPAALRELLRLDTVEAVA